MTEKEKEEIKQMIIDEIEDVEDDIQYLEEAVKPVAPDSSLGRVTRMDALGSKGVHEGLLEQAKEKLNHLQANLRNIDEPDFDKCENCGEPIPVLRLKAVPETRKCIKCSGK